MHKGLLTKHVTPKEAFFRLVFHSVVLVLIFAGLCVLVYFSFSNSKLVSLISIRVEVVTSINPLDYDLVDASTALHDRKIFMIGGVRPSSPGELSDRVIYYNLETSQWVNCTPFPRPTQKLSAVGHGPFVYTFGGLLSSADSSDSIYRYDILNNSWREVGKMSSGRSEARVGVVGDVAYIFGGYSVTNGSESFKQNVEIFQLNSSHTEQMGFNIPSPIFSLFQMSGNEFGVYPVTINGTTRAVIFNGVDMIEYFMEPPGGLNVTRTFFLNDYMFVLDDGRFYELQLGYTSWYTKSLPSLKGMHIGSILKETLPYQNIFLIGLKNQTESNLPTIAIWKVTEKCNLKQKSSKTTF